MTNKYAYPMPPLDVAMNRAGILRHYGASADGEQKKLVVLADEIERLRALLRSCAAYIQHGREKIDPSALLYGIEAALDGVRADEPECRETQAPVTSTNIEWHEQPPAPAVKSSDGKAITGSPFDTALGWLDSLLRCGIPTAAERELIQSLLDRYWVNPFPPNER